MNSKPLAVIEIGYENNYRKRFKLETFTELKLFINNPRYQEQREKSLSRLDINTIDAPIIEIVKGFEKLPFCFTLQSCYGHFVYNNQKNPKNVEPLPRVLGDNISSVEYRIAYIALCIQNSDSGRKLLQDLKEIQEIDPEYVQLGCAEWFWKKQVNSYILQVEPERYKTKDRVTIGFQEALHIEKIRNQVFRELKKIIHIEFYNNHR